jgi:diguanylate cyclase (GGDEF)-like protein
MRICSAEADADLSSRPLSFRRRLTLFFLLIVVLPMIAVAIIVVQVSGESQTGKADARLAAGLETSLSLYDSEVREAGRATSEAARDPRLADALAGGDREAFRAAAPEVADAAGLETLALLDSGGEEVTSVGAADPIAAAEVMLEGAGAGSLVGSTTSAEAFAKRVRERTGDDAAVSVDGRSLASTVPLRGLALPSEGASETVEVEDSEQRAASAILPGPGPADARLTLFAPLEEPGITADEPLVAVALAIFLVVALGFVGLLLRTLQGQVRAMFDAARRIGGGDFSRKVPVEGEDEMAGLAREFNKMSDQLAAQMDDLRRQRVELDESVRRLGAAFASGLDRRALLEIVAETALSACEADAARIDLAGSPDGAIETGRADGTDVREAMRAAESQALRERGAGEASRGQVHALAQPLSQVGSEEVGLGVMAIARADGERFSAEHREVLRYLVGQASVSIENIGLHELVAEQAVTDELTGLANKRGFRDWVDTEASRAERFGHQLSLLMLDIDNFKAVNDTHGHLQGDEVLRTIGRILQRESRGIDEPARYGGEEFAVGLPETNLQGATEVAERIRASIEETEIPMVSGGGSMKVTASLGVATMPDMAADVTNLVGVADEALYRAKRGGKNRVEVASASGAREGADPPLGGDGGAQGRTPAQRN